MTFQVIVAVTFVGFIIYGLTQHAGTGEILSTRPFYSASLDPALIFSGATILCFSFLGFDAISTMSEETIKPKRTIPLAIFLTVAIGGVLFTLTSYFLQQVFPNFQQFKHPDAASLEIAEFVGGAFLHSFFLAGTMSLSSLPPYHHMRVPQDSCMRWEEINHYQSVSSVIFTQH